MKTNPNDPAIDYRVLEENSGEVYHVRARNEREACKKASKIHFKTYPSSEAEFSVLNDANNEDNNLQPEEEECENRCSGCVICLNEFSE